MRAHYAINYPIKIVLSIMLSIMLSKYLQNKVTKRDPQKQKIGEGGRTRRRTGTGRDGTGRDWVVVVYPFFPKCFIRNKTGKY